MTVISSALFMSIHAHPLMFVRKQQNWEGDLSAFNWDMPLTWTYSCLFVCHSEWRSRGLFGVCQESAETEINVNWWSINIPQLSPVNIPGVCCFNCMAECPWKGENLPDHWRPTCLFEKQANQLVSPYVKPFTDSLLSKWKYLVSWKKSLIKIKIYI